MLLYYISRRYYYYAFSSAFSSISTIHQSGRRVIFQMQARVHRTESGRFQLSYFDIASSSLHLITLLCLSIKNKVNKVPYYCSSMIQILSRVCQIPLGQEFCSLDIRRVLWPFTMFNEALQPKRANIQHLGNNFVIRRPFWFAPIPV